MTTEDHKPSQPLRLERILHALGDSVRLGIVRQLAREGESSCAALNGGRSKSTMSHHFKVLREAGLVTTRGQGVTHMNGLCRNSIDAAFPGLLAAVVDGPGADVDSGPADVANRSQSHPERAKARNGPRLKPVAPESDR